MTEPGARMENPEVCASYATEHREQKLYKLRVISGYGDKMGSDTTTKKELQNAKQMAKSAKQTAKAAKYRQQAAKLKLKLSKEQAKIRTMEQKIAEIERKAAALEGRNY